MADTNATNATPPAAKSERKYELADPTRGDRKFVIGLVVSDKMEKTITVQVTRLEKHKKYKKYLRRHTKFYAHDEKREAKVGDTVEIQETRPLSKLKRWRFVKVLAKAGSSGTAK
jgi:small subunit ribosomal protein S17